MFQKARDTAYLESTSLLILIVRWKKPLIISLLIAGLLATFFSGPLFITPKYNSSVIFFPATTNSLSKAILEETGSDKQDILAFGEEEQAEQMLQILNSDEIREVIINKYNLFDHYHVNTSDNFPLTKLNDLFKDNISFSRTEFMSVRIDVMDEDPQLAANIANDISSLLDSMKTKIQHQRASEALKIIEQSYFEKQSDIKLKEDSLQKLRMLGVIDYTSQAEILSQAYTNASGIFANETASLTVLEKYKTETDTSVINTKARIKGAEAKLKGINKDLEQLTKYGGATLGLNSEISYDRQELSKLKTQYEKLKLDANQSLSHKFIVNKAIKAEKKSYPVRWLIIILTLTGTFIVSLLVIMGFQRFKELKY